LKEDHSLQDIASRLSKSRRRMHSEICIFLRSFNIKILWGTQPGFASSLSAEYRYRAGAIPTAPGSGRLK
jgi:hypothetical protein